MKKILESIGLAESNLSAAEWAWRIISFLVVAGGGTTAGLLARGSELFQTWGLLGWFAIGLTSALLLAFLFFLFKLAQKQAAHADYLRALALRESSINPMLAHFTDQVIKLSDLQLPGKPLHSHKQFRRCKFVGPGALVVLGGTYLNCTFNDIGTVLTLPEGVYINGVIGLENCTVENCDFYNLMLIVPQPMATHFRQMGATVVNYQTP